MSWRKLSLCEVHGLRMVSMRPDIPSVKVLWLHRMGLPGFSCCLRPVLYWQGKSM